ncbi:MAG: hypothetical protein IJD65_02240 [Mailhella sp.]|nr:hypothetical protein [Mailhella sp.]
MKKVLAAAALTLLCALPAQAAELFGIEFGAPASKYDIGKEVLAEQGKMKMYKVVPPQPDAGFPGYALTAYDGKVVRITAFSRADYSDEGTETRKLFAATVDRLTKLFGGPAVFDEDLATDSKLTAESQWKQSLLNSERLVQSKWVMQDVKGGDELEAVWLEGNAIPMEPESATFLTLSARVKDFPLYEQKAAQEAKIR